VAVTLLKFTFWIVILPWFATKPRNVFAPSIVMGALPMPEVVTGLPIVTGGLLTKLMIGNMAISWIVEPEIEPNTHLDWGMRQH
jgi:hypothetical protein